MLYSKIFCFFLVFLYCLQYICAVVHVENNIKHTTMKAIDTTLQSGFDSQLSRMLCNQITDLDRLQVDSFLKYDASTMEVASNLSTFLMMTLILTLKIK